MANQTITGTLITVHGRGSLVLPYRPTVKTADKGTVQIDISGRTLYFEVDGAPIRELMVADPDDPKAQKIVLESNQIAILSKTPTRCIIRDETNIAAGLPYVMWNGSINRDGYVGDPDTVNDA
jgi:hypothetical protein